LRPLIESALPAREDVRSIFAAAGFTLSVHQVVTEIVASDRSVFVEKSTSRADSLLARLSDEDFAAGMAALRDGSADIDPGDAVTEEVDWFVFAAPP
jgi:hypothetical protein